MEGQQHRSALVFQCVGVLIYSGLLSSFPELLISVRATLTKARQAGLLRFFVRAKAGETNPEQRCQMLASYSVFIVFGWLLLVVAFFALHAPEKTTSEMIREVR
jgi:hypothetical protein